jgi:hypothetical protein
MDHIFEQKLIRENQQLQFELAKVNKQIKQLQEKVFAYENMIAETYVSKDSIPTSEAELRKKIAADKAAIEAMSGKSLPQTPKIPTTVRMPRNPKLNKLEESHTKQQLQKLSTDQLKKLKAKYTNKPGSKTELNNIKNLLNKKKVNEELLNEIGDTREGQTALKLARARADAMVAWDSTVGKSMAKLDGPEAVAQNEKMLAKNKRVMDLATKRIKPQ